MLNVKSDFLLDSVKEIISTSAVQNEHTILIVDDEINNLQLLKRTLRGKYHILTASNGLEALETLKENLDSVSLIVSDHKMPIMEGTKFLEEANTIAPDVIKILLTGFSDIEIITDAVNKCNLFQYILKPFDPQELQEVIKNGIDKFDLVSSKSLILKDLKEWNNLRNDRIDIGKVLKLSKPDNFDAPKPPQDIKYTVKSGDVLSKIALKYGVSTASIMYKNNIQNPKHIQPGQTIVIPDKAEVAELEAAQRAIKAKQATPSPQRKKVSGSTNVPSPTNTVSLNRGIVVHKVKKGDTLLDISKKYNIPVKDLLLYNYNLKGIKSSENLSEKEVKNVRIIATKNAVIDATGVSEEFINDLISIEKKRNRLYNDDCGIPTIGIGHNTRAHGDTSFYRGKTLSDNQIYSLLARDIFDAQSKIKSAIGKDAFDNLSRGQKEALYGLVFNTGNLSGSPKLVEALKKNDYVEAACQMDQACGKIKGKLQVLPGLAKRRFMDDLAIDLLKISLLQRI